MSRVAAAALLSAASLTLAVVSLRAKEPFVDSKKNDKSPPPPPPLPSPLTPSERAGVENVVIVAYRELLDRDPTKTEFAADVLAITKGTLNPAQLRSRLRASDEHGRIANVQATDLEPGLPRAIVERDVTERLAALYARLKGGAMQPEVALLLYDLYARMDYSEARLGAALLDPRWDAFEAEALRSSALTREKLYALYDKMMPEPVGPNSIMAYNPSTTATASSSASAAREQEQERTFWKKMKYMFDAHRRVPPASQTAE